MVLGFFECSGSLFRAQQQPRVSKNNMSRKGTYLLYQVPFQFYCSLRVLRAVTEPLNFTGRTFESQRGFFSTDFPERSVRSVSLHNPCLVLHILGGDALQELLRPSGRLRLPLVVPTRGVSTVHLSQASPNVTRESRGHRQSPAVPDRKKQLARWRRSASLNDQLPDSCDTEYDQPTKQDLASESSW